MTRPAASAFSASGPRRPRVVLVAALCAGLMGLAPTAFGIVDISVTDGLIAERTARPSAADPGPVLFDTTDGLTFSSGLTNVATIWYARLTGVTNNSSASTGTVQGTVHAFSAWFFGKQDAAGRFVSFAATGVRDADAASYSVPLLFTKSSQGTLTLTSYDAAAPVDGGTTVTYFWAYDAGANRYVIGASKDLSLQTRIAPMSDPLGTTFQRTLETNRFVITGVGGAPDYVPTIEQGMHLPLLSLPGSVTWYLLMDTPAGVHEDTYGYTVTVFAQGL